MPLCPWYVSAHAVRRYVVLTGSRLAFDDASDELIERAAACWRRYTGNPALAPAVSKTGAYVYREAGHDRVRRRLRFVVEMDRRPEGPKPQVVDVVF